MDKKIFRSSTDKKIAGVCGGIGEYFGWDPNMVRLIWAIVCCFAGAGVLAYIVAALLLPEEPTF